MKIHLYNIPSVDQWVNQLIASYITIQSQFSQGDILLADKINRLQQKSRYMIKNIDEFMNRNALDPRVRYLYGARNKLSKFLFKINDNQLVKNVNQMKQNESVFETSLVNKKRESVMNSINEKENQYYQQSRRNDLNSDHNDQRVVFEDVNESFQTQLGKKPQIPNKYNKGHQYSDVKPYNIQQSTPQQKQTVYKHTPKNNSMMMGHNRTLSTRLKPYQQQYEKQKFQPSYYEHRQKSRTPVKTSRKVQSFTPRNTNITTSVRQQQSNNESNYLQKPQLLRQQQQLRSDNKKSSSTIITPRTRLNNNNNNSDHVIQRTPTNVNKGVNNSSSLSNKKNSNKNINQSFVISNSHMQKSNEKQSQVQQRQKLFTPRRQQQQINSVRPSSAMKSLANLIFTIKMTKQEYNEFKKIKQMHQGQTKMANSYIRQ